ncbi:hypothetical protein ACB092_03G226800 [Castanea dentata]
MHLFLPKKRKRCNFEMDILSNQIQTFFLLKFKSHPTIYFVERRGGGGGNCPPQPPNSAPDWNPYNITCSLFINPQVAFYLKSIFLSTFVIFQFKLDPSKTHLTSV